MGMYREPNGSRNGGGTVKYVAVSGGADSTATALLLWERGEDFELVFADTGAELPEVFFLLPRLAALTGKALRVVSGGSFFQYLAQFGYMLPNVQCRWCTRLLKQVPQANFYEAHDTEAVAIGIRADEPKRLRTHPYGGKGYEVIYPLNEAGIGRDDARRLCEKYEMLNPVYRWRSSVSCFPCFFQRKTDWLGLLKHHPTLYAVAEEWEQQAVLTSKQGYTWRRGATLAALRLADERQLRFWPEPSAEPCIICDI